MSLSRNKKNNVYPCKPQFYYIKVGLKGVKIYRHVFVMICFGGCPADMFIHFFDLVFFFFFFFFLSGQITIRIDTLWAQLLL